MKKNDLLVFIKKNYSVIVIGICAVVFLFFLSGILEGDKQSDENDVSSLAKELESFLMNLEGVGECKVMIYKDTPVKTSYSSSVQEKISGIAVICDGGNNSSVKNSIIEVLTRLFGLSGNRISINAKW
ncbi:MAG: hypothetical protein IJE40_04230 [Clostridia bacterium]|nr:hypothetical protein [Clostridia bacterium]